MPSIKAIEVRLDVASVTRSADFYADMLGFEVRTLWPSDSPQFAILNRDGVRLLLGRREETSVTASSPPACTLWLDVAGIADLHSTIKDKVNIEWGPEVYFYRRREFAFKIRTGTWLFCPKSPLTHRAARRTEARRQLRCFADLGASAR